MILCIGTTPAVQRVMVFRHLALDAVNRATTTLDGAAGKSINVAKVLHALGERVVATGFLGGDRGMFVRSVLAGQGVESEFVEVSAQTRQCVTVIDQSGTGVTELVEESPAVAPGDFDALADVIQRRVAGCRAVVMSGTLAPGGAAEFYRQCTQQAHAAGALTVVDAQGPPLLQALEAGPGLVKPNRAELAATVGRALNDEAAVRTAMRELHERGARQVVVTAGRSPSLAFDGQRFWRIASPQVAAVNPIGSGDSFTAGLVSRLVRGEDLGEASRWGAAAGSANALSWMAGEVRRADVERLALEVQVERLRD